MAPFSEIKTRFLGTAVSSSLQMAKSSVCGFLVHTTNRRSLRLKWFQKCWVSHAKSYFQTSQKVIILHGISKLPRHHEIAIWVTQVVGNASFSSLIKFSKSLVNRLVVGHLLNVVSVESVALDKWLCGCHLANASLTHSACDHFGRVC